jgi:UDP-N-acetylmuramoyl-L-alanyl-D-glutamate--2,6-diaminopimelate ligase
MVEASAAICHHPEAHLVLAGVTGTNGKTSVTTMLASIWRALGHHADVIGTLTHERTTPASPELFRTLREIADRRASDATLVSMEVSSHALDQGRVDGLTFAVAGFTNLSRDHLDYHGTMEAYFDAKARLFSPTRCQRAVVWVDDTYGARLASSLDVPVAPVRRSDASDVSLELGATRFTWRGRPVRTTLSGGYNLDNALVALTMAVELGASAADAADAIALVDPVPGRFDVVATRPRVVVDYAHTPDGLGRLLDDVRQLSGGARVIVVFGCGGDRDRGKRPEMGRVAATHADEIIVTSDNPRSENPESIIDEIVAGMTDGANWRRESDRRRAIETALRAASGADVVVVAGKGHEKTQIVGTDVLEFDDRLVVGELLR